MPSWPSSSAGWQVRWPGTSEGQPNRQERQGREGGAEGRFHNLGVLFASFAPLAVQVPAYPSNKAVLR